MNNHPIVPNLLTQEHLRKETAPTFNKDLGKIIVKGETK